MTQDTERARRTPTRELNGRGLPVEPRRRSLLYRLIRTLVILGIVSALFAGAGVLWFLHGAERTPREWAPYLERRAQNHRPSIVSATTMVAEWLVRADRLERNTTPDIPKNIGASADRSGTAMAGRLRMITSQAELRAAVDTARPGDVLQFPPGTYRIEGRDVRIKNPGLPTAPIVLRAARLGDVTIESNLVVTFKITAPYWRFENLVIDGICDDHTYCEHAFHVVGSATNTTIRNNRLVNLNAHIKINGEDGQFPDNGVIQGNTITNAKPRDTRNSITPIDLVAASGWRMSENFIADFARAGGGNATYGAFAKGAGENNVFERNVVICEWRLRDLSGQRIGLSLGGGGTDLTLRREQGTTGFEQTGGVIRDNLIAFCSDDGIYVNRSVRSVLEHNTLLDTVGIDVRFPESSADMAGNIVDGLIRARDGGLLRTRSNETSMLLGLFVGMHPARSHYQDVARLDLRWRDRPTAIDGAENRRDLCGAPRPSRPVPGAFEDFAKCQ